MLMLDKVGPGAQGRSRVTRHFENIADQVAKIAVADWKAGSPSLSQANVLVIPPGQTREVLWGHDVSVEELRRTVGEDPETARVALTFHVRDNALSTHDVIRSEEHTSELQSLMRISYAVFCLKKKNNTKK